MALRLRGKLTLTYVLVTLVTLLIVNLIALKSVESFFLKNIRVNTSASGSIMVNAGRGLLKSTDPKNDQRWAQITKDFQGRALLVNNRLEIVYDSTRPGRIQKELLTHPLAIEAIKGKSSHSIQKLVKDGRVLYLALPIAQNKEIIGLTFLAVNIDHIYADLSNLRWQLFGLSVLAALVIILLSHLVSHLISKPIRVLTETANSLGEGNLDQRVTINSKDELGQLGEAFNSMAEHLKKADDSRREFISNASHELKTPLASIKALSESLLNSKSNDIKLYQDFLKDIDKEVNRLSGLVQSLLQVASLDAKYQINPTLTNVKELLDLASKKMEFLAKEKDIKVVVNVAIDLNWPLEPSAFQQILLNLVDNSLKYSPPGTTIILKGWLQNEKLFIEVKDEGIGIPAKELPHIFERFYRVDKHRARVSGGTGLGLSIVKRLIELHGGEITIISEEGKGTTVRISLPS